jgi:nucleoside-diphosphate-sugar epimerase
MDANNQVACVTGATGMIGNQIVTQLLARGYLVRVLTRKGYPVPGARIFKADLSDSVALNDFVRGADLVFHCAAELRNVSKMREVNIFGTTAIRTLVEKHHVRYFCHLSSAGVVGSTTESVVDEDTACKPQNEYESTKLEAEIVARAPIHGCNTVILRPTNVVDENHLGELSLPASGSFKNRIKAFVKGGEVAHIVHAEDVARAAVFFTDQTPSTNPRVFFVSLDDDPMNTVAKLWSLYSATKAGRDATNVTPLPHLPLFIPHILRRIVRHTGNYGNITYSSRRLAAEGFRFSLRVSDIVARLARAT